MDKSYFVFRRISHIFTHSVEDFFNIFPMKRLSIIFFLFVVIFAVHGQPDAVVLSHYLFPEFQEGKVLMKDGTDGRVYDLKLPDDFKVKPYMVYWIEKEGKLKSFLSLGQLKSFYKKKKKLYEEYVKNHKVEFEDPKSIADLINYMETH
ncbi:MAG: hypothetical protein WAO94_03585 [Dysgonamonadaceae bacterium]|jgi:hypothetical protein|nr:hypothetical protein [Dysgonamonadaceae bacterium]